MTTTRRGILGASAGVPALALPAAAIACAPATLAASPLTLHNLSRYKGSRRKRLHARKQVRHVTAFGSARGERTHVYGLFKVSSNLL